MSNTEAFKIAFNRVTATVAEGFFDAVKVRKVELENNVGEQVRKLFEDIASTFGDDGTPSKIAGFTAWSDLTEGWIDRKKSGSNRFYLGLRKGMVKTVRNRGNQFVYGTPTVEIGEGIGRGFSTDRGGRLRIAKGFSGGGRYASRSSALRATLTITPFPELGDGEEMFSPFRGKAGKTLIWGEFGTDANRPARPFLAPFVRYYTEVKIPAIIERTIRL